MNTRDSSPTLIAQTLSYRSRADTHPPRVSHLRQTLPRTSGPVYLSPGQLSHDSPHNSLISNPHRNNKRGHPGHFAPHLVAIVNPRDVFLRSLEITSTSPSPAAHQRKGRESHSYGSLVRSSSTQHVHPSTKQRKLSVDRAKSQMPISQPLSHLAGPANAELTMAIQGNTRSPGPETSAGKWPYLSVGCTGRRRQGTPIVLTSNSPSSLRRT